MELFVKWMFGGKSRMWIYTEHLLHSQKAYKFVQFSDPAKINIFAHLSSSLFL